MNYTRISKGVLRHYRDEFAIDSVRGNVVTFSPGGVIFENGQVWETINEHVVVVPADAEWYTLALQLMEDLSVKFVALRGFSWDDDRDKVSLASIQCTSPEPWGGPVSIEDRRQFAMWR